MNMKIWIMCNFLNSNYLKTERYTENYLSTHYGKNLQGMDPAEKVLWEEIR